MEIGRVTLTLYATPCYLNDNKMSNTNYNLKTIQQSKQELMKYIKTKIIFLSIAVLSLFLHATCEQRKPSHLILMHNYPETIHII